MENTKHRVDDGSGIDRLSNLPEEVLEHIFSFVETIDVVRTCVLSRKWRHLWTKVPSLDFCQGGFRRSLGFNASIQVETRKFWKFITSMLVTRNSLPMSRLRFSGKSYQELLDVMLWYAGEGHCQELDLWAQDSGSDCGPLEIPRALCESLTRLKLVLHFPDEFRFETKFRALKNLYLEQVKLMNGGLIERLFFSEFTALEELLLLDCHMAEIRCLNFSASNLKKFTFVNLLYPYTYDDYDPSFDGELIVNAPNLLYFYTGRLLSGYSLENLSSLENASFRIFSYGNVGKDPSALPNIIRGITHVKTLALSNLFMKYFAQVSDEIMSNNSTLYYLRCLKLDLQRDLTTHMVALLNLLKLCCNLEKLTLKFRSIHEEGLALLE